VWEWLHQLRRIDRDTRRQVNGRTEVGVVPHRVGRTDGGGSDQQPGLLPGVGGSRRPGVRGRAQ
ncbi:MAG: hypothetical protein ACRDTF_05155, partial [Pseudonocardiaceae bacterium]